MTSAVSHTRFARRTLFTCQPPAQSECECDEPDQHPQGIRKEQLEGRESESPGKPTLGNPEN